MRAIKANLIVVPPRSSKHTVSLPDGDRRVEGAF
jgi:hypothetical protein